MGLELKDVSLSFDTKGGQVDAVRNVTLSINDHEFVCIVGPSGCGKTTLLNVIAGFLQPKSGEVLLDGQPVKGPGPDRGVVFQQPVALLPWLSVSGNVEFGPRMMGVQKQHRKQIAQHYLNMVGLWEFRDRAIYELSGGMQQRVALCRVLANEPRVLLMDEPFGALDALTREKMQEELARLTRQTGKTVFFITHSVDEAVLLGSKVVIMSARPGRIINQFSSNFANQLDGRDIPDIKSNSVFIELRQEVLKLIWANS